MVPAARAGQGCGKFGRLECFSESQKGTTMSISPATDIVQDVMRAASAQRLRAAEKRLRGFSRAPVAAAQEAGVAWTRELATAAKAMPRLAPAPSRPAAAAEKGRAAAGRNAPFVREKGRAGPAGAAHGARKVAGRRLGKAYAGLEGLVLENMLNGMLGDGKASVFGGGLAGEFWKSLLARGIAGQVSRRGGLGIATTLVRRAGAPDGVGGAADATGVKQQLERVFLSGIERRDADGAHPEGAIS